MAIEKRKRVSKKTKSSWRKHVDIKDVDAFLEEQRLEERIGWDAKQEDSELFHVDVTPDVSRNIVFSKQKKRLALSKKPLKCRAALEPYTKVPDPIKKRNRVRSKDERRNELIKRKEAERILNGKLRMREEESYQDRMIHQLNKRLELNKDKFDVDIWNSEDSIKCDDWVSTGAKIQLQKAFHKTTKTAPKSLHIKSSVMNAVEIPHPGLSYNPRPEDHQELISEVLKKEAEMMKKEEHLNRVTKDVFKSMPSKKQERMWMEEMSQGLKTSQEGNTQVEIKEEDVDNSLIRGNPPVKNKKKTLKQKRKKREHNLRESMKKMTKQEKRKIADIYKLRFINNQVEKIEEKTKQSQEQHKHRLEKKKLGTKRLSAVRFEEPDIEFQASDELPGNLRNLKNTTNLLADRFKSLQKRNILEPGLKRTMKRTKRKRFVKSDHRDDWKITVSR